MSVRLAFLALAFALVASAHSASWTTLPNVRCHNSFTEFHNISTLAVCEAQCDASPSVCGVVSWCPPSGGEGCPYTSGCWLFPSSVLNASCDHTGATGWQSAFTVRPPPPPPPSDWMDRVSKGAMAFTSASPSEIGEGFFPVVGNGFIGFEVGPFIQPFTNSWPWRDAGSLKLSGVYSGYNYSSPSHRAQIPRLTAFQLVQVAGDGVVYEAVGTAVDYGLGIFYNRTRVKGGGCAQSTIVETRTFAHRPLRELFLFELAAFPETPAPDWPGCTFSTVWDISLASPSLQPLKDCLLSETRAPGVPYAVWSGTTAVPEEPGLSLRSIAVVFDAWASPNVTTLTLTPGNASLTLRAVLRSDLDVLHLSTSSPVTNPVQVVTAAAVSLWENYTSSLSPQETLDLHVKAWSELWEDGGIELTGNATLAAVVNASTYDIVSSLREDWNWSTSPGGLATGGYSGHSLCVWCRGAARKERENP